MGWSVRLYIIIVSMGMSESLECLLSNSLFLAQSHWFSGTVTAGIAALLKLHYCDVTSKNTYDTHLFERRHNVFSQTVVFEVLKSLC